MLAYACNYFSSLASRGKAAHCGAAEGASGSLSLPDCPAFVLCWSCFGNADSCMNDVDLGKNPELFAAFDQAPHSLDQISNTCLESD